MTKAQREEAARKHVCPRCHAEANRKCFKMARGYRMSGKASWSTMKTIHAERLALVEES